jgi:hypothetical protein
MITVRWKMSRQCRRALVGTVLVVLRVGPAWAQREAPHPAVVVLPSGSVTRIPSPDRHWVLIFECPDFNEKAYQERKLWIEDSRSHSRRLVKEYERSAAISWTPDSQRFFVEDAFGSNGSLSYVIEPATLKTTDLSSIIASSDGEAEQYLKAGHSYLAAKRWLSSHELRVILFGHFDGDASPSVLSSFTIRYNVDISGRARRISKLSTEEPY